MTRAVRGAGCGSLASQNILAARILQQRYITSPIFVVGATFHSVIGNRFLDVDIDALSNSDTLEVAHREDSRLARSQHGDSKANQGELVVRGL